MFPRRCNYCYCGLMPQSQTRCIKVSPCRGRRHAVTVAGLRAWNSLPASLRDTVTFTASESCCRAVTMFIFLLSGAYKYSYLLTYMLSTQQSVTSAGNILSRLTPWNHTLDAVDKLSICWRMFEEIKSSPELLQKFLITAILTEQWLQNHGQRLLWCIQTFHSNAYVSGNDLNRLLVEQFLTVLRKKPCAILRRKRR